MKKTLAFFGAVLAAITLFVCAAPAQDAPTVTRLSVLSVTVTPEVNAAVMAQARMVSGRVVMAGSNLIISGPATIRLPIDSITNLIELPAGIYPTNFTGGTFSVTTNRECRITAQFVTP
jgi:hypothetical protein